MTFKLQSNAALECEAVYLHRFFFHERPAPEIISRYVEANRACLLPADVRAIRTVEQVISRGLDPEAVEYVLRLGNRENLFTRKLKVLFFLVEVRAAYADHFFNWEQAGLKASGALFSSLILAAYKYLKGRLLISRYDLV